VGMKIKHDEMGCLEIMSWSFAANGEHYYGYICYTDAEGEYVKHQLSYPLNKVQAASLNKKDSNYDFLNWEEGQLSQRYFTEEQVRADAIKYFYEVLEPLGLKLLVEGSYATAQPQPVIAYSEDYKELADLFTSLYKKGERVDWDWDIAPKGLEKLCDEWNSHLIW
jgi:hypothetical protein